MAAAKPRRPGLGEDTATEAKEKYAYEYFLKHVYLKDDHGRKVRLKPFQAAAIVANFAVESRDPRKRGRPELLPKLGQIRGGGGYGIAQWTLAQRKQALHDFSPRHWDEFRVQVAYAARELRSTSGQFIPRDTLELLLHAGSLEEATAIVQTGFERPGGQTGRQSREVPSFRSVVTLLSEEQQDGPLKPLPIEKDSSGYLARVQEAKAVLHERERDQLERLVAQIVKILGRFP